MRNSAPTQTFEGPVFRACAQFASQVRPILPMEALTVVLVEPDGNTSRVVYSWVDTKRSWNSPAPPVKDASGLPDESYSMRIPLETQAGFLGEVLARGRGPNLYSQSRRGLVQEIAANLALALENFKLQQQLGTLRKESEILKRLANETASGVPLYRMFRCFAREIKPLVEYHRLTVFLVDRESDLLIPAYHAGQRPASRPVGDSNSLSSGLIGRVASTGQCQILDDLSEGPASNIWERDAGQGLRSAILVPIKHVGHTVGVVVLEHRLPRAYGSKAQEKLEMVTAALAPPIGRLLALTPPAASHRQDDEALQELIGVLSASSDLESGFPSFVTALSRLLEFDVAALSWIDPNGFDIRTVRSTPDFSRVQHELSSWGSAGIAAKLRSKGRVIGILTVLREKEGGFSPREQATLNHIGVQIAPSVQSNRLYVHARRQAHQLQQMNRARATEPLDAARLLEADRLGEDVDPPGVLSREFLVDIAHSFRNPLTSIKGVSSTLLQSDVVWPPEMHQEFIRLIDQETDRLDRVVSDLLVPPLGHMDMVDPARQETTIKNLFEEARFQLAGEQPPLAVAIAVDPAISPVLADTSMLVRVICYLASATAQRYDCGGVQVKATMIGGQPLVSIAPIGTAGDPEKDPQYHGVESLQLEICRTLLEAHGQMLGEGPIDGGGVSFWFFVPADTTNRQMIVGLD
ncbi:MAG: hypothetical protein BZY88_19350 [SAR202 cluster bacterium Io17-Chloro-G9]|nr:MAG: hypothetical protein BZY88_19350 [SAR202 cluster bacterium Io17-Chloro-G9]